MRNKNVQLDVVVVSQTRRRRKVDPGIADCGGDPSESAGLVLDLDYQVERNRTGSRRRLLSRALCRLAAPEATSTDLVAQIGAPRRGHGSDVAEDAGAFLLDVRNPIASSWTQQTGLAGRTRHRSIPGNLARFRGRYLLSEWNDTPGRTREQVLVRS
jgi:hypothetical protein